MTAECPSRSLAHIGWEKNRRLPPTCEGATTGSRYELVLVSDTPGGSSVARSKRAKCMEKVARPWLSERSSVE
jgi:hypothetical protein